MAWWPRHRLLDRCDVSVEVLLVPLGIAAFGAVSTAMREARSKELCEKCKATRITDPEILRQSLDRMGVMITHDEGGRIRATGRWGPLTFQKVGDIYLGRVDGNDTNATRAMLTELDSHVGRIAQLRTAAIVEQRAMDLGFRLIQQRDEDGVLSYVFEEIA